MFFRKFFWFDGDFLDFLKEWAVTLCVCSVGSGILCFLIPKGNMEKVLRIVVSIFLLAVVISPFFERDFSLRDFSFEGDAGVEEAENVAREIERAAAESFARRVVGAVADVLAAEGFIDLECEVLIVSDDAGRIFVEGIVLRGLVLAEDVEFVGDLVFRETGIFPRIEN